MFITNKSGFSGCGLNVDDRSLWLSLYFACSDAQPVIATVTANSSLSQSTSWYSTSLTYSKCSTTNWLFSLLQVSLSAPIASTNSKSSSWRRNISTSSTTLARIWPRLSSRVLGIKITKIFLKIYPQMNADGLSMTLNLRRRALADGTSWPSYPGESTPFSSSFYGLVAFEKWASTNYNNSDAHPFLLSNALSKQLGLIFHD